MVNFQERLKSVLAKRQKRLIDKSKEGGEVITYVSPHIPLELLEASGAEYINWDWFISLYGSPEEYIQDEVPDQYFPKDWCLYSKSNFILEVKDPKPKISLVVIAYTCDPITKMWEYIEKKYPIFYLNLSRVINESSTRYWCESIKSLKEHLEKLTGNEINEERLKEIVTQEAQIREKLAELRLGVLRKAESPLKASDLLQLLSLRRCLGQQEYLVLLEEVSQMMGAIPEKEEGKKPIFYLLGPLFLEESPKVLSDEIVTGSDILKHIEKNDIRTIEDPWTEILTQDSYEVPEGKSALEWVGENSYLRPKHPCLSPNTAKIDENQALAQKFGVKGVIYFNYKGCRVSLMESRLNEYMFDAEGIPYLHLQVSGRLGDIDNINVSAESFIMANC